MRDVNSPEFWQRIYQRGRPGWDLGKPVPVFRRLLERSDYLRERGNMIVLGAGKGHDARMFARAGFGVTAVDFAAEAVESMHELAEPDAPITIMEEDIFHLPHRIEHTVDYVLEYTCFCAIDPRRREEYADIVDHLIAPDGLLIALLFPVWNRTGGPPFAVSPDEFERLMQIRGFEVVYREMPADSVSSRQGLEELLIFCKSD